MFNPYPPSRDECVLFVEYLIIERARDCSLGFSLNVCWTETVSAYMDRSYPEQGNLYSNCMSSTAS